MTTLHLRAGSYEQDRDYVLAVLSRRCGWLDCDEREATLHDAYAVLLEKERAGDLDPGAMHPRQLRAYLTQTAVHKALDEGKRVERKRSEPIGDRALAEPDPSSQPDELAAAAMDNARVREIVSELPERAQTIVKLRFYFDRTPEEIQGFLKITERCYRRDLERALRSISEAYELVREDRYCDSRRSLILAYVAGVAGPGRMAKAREHLDACPGCRAWAAQLREATESVAALLPVPALAVGHGPLSRLVESATALRDGLGDATGAAKQQAASLIGRVDPSAPQYVAAARPGTVATMVAGCIAIGAGATYCAVEGLPGAVRSLPGLQRPGKERPEKAKRKAEVRPAAGATPVATRKPVPAPAPAPVAKAPAPKQKPQPQRQPSQPAQSAAAPPPPAPKNGEFGFEAPTQTAGGSTSTAAPAPSAPAPAPPPPAPPGEFDP